MAKKSKKKDVDTGPARELKHSPFAALLGDPSSPLPSSVPPSTDEAEPAEAQAGPPGAVPVSFSGKVVVRRETKGRGGKTVTRVSGVPEAHLGSLALEMKQALGCGAKVELGDLLLLGDVADRAVAWLERAGARRVVRGS